MLIKIWENYKLKQVKNSTKTIFHINKWKKIYVLCQVRPVQPPTKFTYSGQIYNYKLKQRYVI